MGDPPENLRTPDGQAPPSPTPASVADIDLVWRGRWGLPVVTSTGAWMPGDVQGLRIPEPDGGWAGLVTFRVGPTSLEIVTLDARSDGHGTGRALLAAVEVFAREAGLATLVVETTNDNLRAFQIYVRAGFRLVRVRCDAMDRVRALKPWIPEVGANGLPLRDVWELEKRLP